MFDAGVAEQMHSKVFRCKSPDVAEERQAIIDDILRVARVAGAWRRPLGKMRRFKRAAVRKPVLERGNYE